MRAGLITHTHSSGAPLPLPIRVSSGFFVTGLSGKMRIQIFPPRLMWRGMAERSPPIPRALPPPPPRARRPQAPHQNFFPPLVRPRPPPRLERLQPEVAERDLLSSRGEPAPAAALLFSELDLLRHHHDCCLSVVSFRAQRGIPPPSARRSFAVYAALDDTYAGRL